MRGISSLFIRESYFLCGISSWPYCSGIQFLSKVQSKYSLCGAASRWANAFAIDRSH